MECKLKHDAVKWSSQIHRLLPYYPELMPSTFGSFHILHAFAGDYAFLPKNSSYLSQFFQQVRFSSNAAWIVYLSDFRVVHLNRITRWQDQSYLKMTRIMCIGHATNVNLRWPQLFKKCTALDLSSGSTGGPHNLFRLLFYSKCTGFTVCFTYSDVSLTMYINQW